MLIISTLIGPNKLISNPFFENSLTGIAQINTVKKRMFASQQEAYSRVITFITAFSAGIPTIFRVFTMFSVAGKTPKTE